MGQINNDGEKEEQKNMNSCQKSGYKKGLRMGTELTQLRVTMGTEEEARPVKALMTVMMTMARKVCVNGEG